MKKLLVLLMACLLVVAACGNKEEKTSNNDKVDFKLDNGKTIKIPKKPKRIVLMAPSYAGNLLALGVKPVGSDPYPFASNILKDKLKGVEQVKAGDVEKIATLKPDLIISFDTDKNNKKYEKIAPTIPFKYEKHNYLDIHVLLGKIVGKEKEAQKFVDDWKAKTKKDGEEIKSHLGADKTYSIIQFFQKQVYVYGDNWGRGSEIIYQAFGLKMQDEVVKDVKKTGWKEISAEQISKYTGDILLVSSDTGKIASNVTDSNVWKNMDAVKNNHVVQYNSADYWFNDPISLEVQRQDLKEKLLKLNK
ncbi:ABC transporter substrate-binding protein [Macrococcus sp. DPC7161]|uniref:ABC transporter substrate-binding protein n=1 Tax=Macrococcus sp. DPC7161 TaxID=2507060 RepID=UPI00100ACA92|nr:ABC transporter substrate-binding protein [Macrococcus sp. DPC7161]RXK18580.1 ferrichrome ABC transporter substrate-binding protein [Macrococcus sp. DPC7161]